MAQTDPQHAGKAFEIDLNRCTGCQACILACAIENELPIHAAWRTVFTFNDARDPKLPRYHLTSACHHCDDPACLRGCPTLAYSKDEITGAVVLDDDRCMGCKYCTWMCPYDAPRFDADRGIVQKCTFCNDRLHDGLEPACVAWCPTTALGLTDSASRNGQAHPPGFTDSSIGPAVRFVPLRSNARMPQFEHPAELPAFAQPLGLPTPKDTPKVTLRSEWTLLVFTLLAPLLVAWFAALWIGNVTGAPRSPNLGSRFALTLPMHSLIYIATGFAALGISTLHVGRKARAWRAVLNWRRSWLSREVLFFSAFFALSSICVIAAAGAGSLNLGSRLADTQQFPTLEPLGWIAILLGVAALFSMDKVYDVAATVRPTREHSASVLLTGALFFGVLTQLGLVALFAGITKAFLYIRRKLFAQAHTTRPGSLRDATVIRDATVRERARARTRPILTFLRLVLGLLLPFGLWFVDAPSIPAVILACCLAGELIDRAEFYSELDIITPARQIALDQQAERHSLSSQAG